MIDRLLYLKIICSKKSSGVTNRADADATFTEVGKFAQNPKKCQWNELFQNMFTVHLQKTICFCCHMEKAEGRA